MKWDVQMTARKRDRVTGERNRWRHGPFVSYDGAFTHAAKMRQKYGRKVLVEVKEVRPTAKTRGAMHVLRTRAGMARARGRGKKIGRPRARFDLRRARRLVEGHAMGRTVGLGVAAALLHVSVSTLKRALRAGSKGLRGNGSKGVRANPRSNAKGAS